MYHAHFRGTHYEAGFRWGSLLLKHKNIILENIPFEITQERIDYALSCLPIYEKYYHEIVEEIQGLADGQQCDVRILQAVLFSMYSMPPSCNCSCFAFTTGEEIFLGRNSDFLTEIERLNQNVIYKLTDGVYSFTGNTTAFVEIEDGVNEHGLAVGLTSVYPYQCKLGFNAGMIVRYLLEKCKNVSETVSCLYQLPIASAQTLTLQSAPEPLQRQPGKQLPLASLCDTGERAGENGRRALYGNAGEMPRAYGAAQKRRADRGRREAALRKGTGNGADRRTGQRHLFHLPDKGRGRNKGFPL